MPRLACIISALGNTESLETTLVSVLERRPDDCEVLVVLNAPYHDPYNLQGEIQFLQAPAKSDLIACLNLGISTTQAPIVHVLASGWQAGDGWIERALAQFDDQRVAAVTPVVYDTTNPDRVLAAGVGYRRGGRKTISRVLSAQANETSLNSVGPLVQAAFYRKSALESIGGISAELGENLADIDLALSLRAAGWRIALDPTSRVLAPAVDEISASGFLAGLGSERLFWRHASELGKLSGMLAHPGTVLGDLINTSPKWKIPGQLLGKLVALLETSHYRRHRQTMIAAKAQAATAAKTDSSINSTRSGQQLRVDTPHKAAGPKENRQAVSSRRQKTRK